MGENIELKRAQDLKQDLFDHTEKGDEIVLSKQDLETLTWMFEEAEKAAIYRGAMEYIRDRKPKSLSSFADIVFYETEERFRLRQERRKKSEEGDE